MSEFHITRVKICGIRNPETAMKAIECGASAVGFVFYGRSPRNILPGDARAIIAKLPLFVSKVGVFVEQGIQQIIDTVKESGVDIVQLAGGQGMDFLEILKSRLDKPVIYAFQVQELSHNSLNSIRFAPAEAVLIDKLVPGEWGGTGERVPVRDDLTGDDREFIRQRVIIAGGVNSSNARSIIDTIEPFGLDLSSGVESERGVKDPKLIEEFFKSIR
jgi:phosphoribosylanthranilate isomerase